MNPLDWLEEAYKCGHRDGYAERKPRTRRMIARAYIGPVYGAKDADCLVAVYRLGFSVGNEDMLAAVAADLVREDAA